MTFSKTEKIKFSLFAIIFFFLIFLFYFFVLSDKTKKMNKESSSLYFNISPTEDNNVWKLIIPNHPLMHGTIYNSKIINRSSHNITSWKIIFKITKPVYLTNCWNGSIEIHQKIEGKKYIQSAIQLKNKDYHELKKLNVKKFCAPKKPLLIYLNPGDVLIYYPDSEYSEKNIPAFSGGEYYNTDIGFIFHKNDTEPLNMDFDFANAYITYHLENYIADNIFAYILGILFIFWLFFLFYNIRIKLLEVSRLKEYEHDKRTIDQIMTVFTKLIDAKDIYTGGHSERVALYSRMIAKEAGRSEEFCQKVFYCGLLHDSGKISIGDDLLSKTSSLTEEEFITTRTHTIKGYELLKSLSSIPEACQAALYHHERFNGTGYPEHLSGNFIPEVARIVAVADSYDTMNSERYYRKGLSKEKILLEFTNNSGTQFDPEFVNAFINLVKKGKL